MCREMQMWGHEIWFKARSNVWRYIKLYLEDWYNILTHAAQL